MRLIVKDMITITAIRPSALLPREVIDVDEARGRELLARHPKVFALAETVAGEAETQTRRRSKAAPKQEKPA